MHRVAYILQALIMKTNENLEWIRKGNTGCVFATLFSKNPENVGWEFVKHEDYKYNNSLLISIVFPKYFTKSMVRIWALQNNFFEESTGANNIGLRIKCKEGVSWVQYFGKDSHVKTRQAPVPMLMFTNKLNRSYYAKVGFKGILHLAHAFSDKVKENIYDLLWQRSYKQTKKILGHSPTIKEAAKTTWERF